MSPCLKITTTTLTLCALAFTLLILLPHAPLPNAYILEITNSATNIFHADYTRLYYTSTCTGWSTIDALTYVYHSTGCKSQIGGYSFSDGEVEINLRAPFAMLVLGVIFALLFVILEIGIGFTKWGRIERGLVLGLSTLSFVFLTISSSPVTNLMNANYGPTTYLAPHGEPFPQFIAFTWCAVSFSGLVFIIECFAMFSWWKARRNRGERCISGAVEVESRV